jgi:general secretion pathway protein F
MSIFNYNAYDASGRRVNGSLDAIGVRDAVQRLKKDGLYPLKIAEAGMEKGIGKKVSSHEIALTTRQLASLLSSGATLSDALGVLSKEEKNKRLKTVLFHIRDEISEGNSLSNALSGYPDIFSGIYTGMVAAGEAGGSLDIVLQRLSDYLEVRHRVVSDVQSALTYPIFMSIVGIGVLLFLFVFVIPKITAIFEGTKNPLPSITVILLWITNFIRYYWYLLIAGGIGGTWGIRFFIKRPSGKAAMDRLLLKIPYVGSLMLHFYIVTLTGTLGSLLNGGIPMIKALKMTKGVLNHTVFNEVIDRAIADVISGTSLSASIKKNEDVMPPVVCHIITVGEKGGNLSDMLLKVSETYRQEFESGIKRGLSLLEPVMILIMGMVVGFIVIAILLPIFELNQIIR